MTSDRLRRDAGSFIADSLADGIACPEFGAIMPPTMFERARRWQRRFHAHGFAGIDWPVEYGGRGLTNTHTAVRNEECARSGVAAYMNFQRIVLAGAAIRKFATPEQQARYLDATLRADIVWCQLFSEPGAGSDLASLTTRAERDGDGWRVTGQTVWSSTAQLAQHAILLARTDPAEPGHRGISFFLFDMVAPGVEVRPIPQMTGDSEFCEVLLDRAPVAADDLLGPLRGGWTVDTSVLADERASVGAASIALQRRQSAMAALSGDPSVRDRASVLQADGRAIASLLGRGGGDPTLGPVTKLARTELDAVITTLAVDAAVPTACSSARRPSRSSTRPACGSRAAPARSSAT